MFDVWFLLYLFFFVLASSALDRGFENQSSQTKDYKIGICCFSAKYAALRSKSKDWLARNQMALNNNHSPSYLVPCHWIFNMSNTSATSGANRKYLPFHSTWDHTWFLVVSKCSIINFLCGVLSNIVCLFGHCIVCPSIYGYDNNGLITISYVYISLFNHLQNYHAKIHISCHI